MKLQSLKNNREFKYVYKKGTSYLTNYFVIYVLKSKKKFHRLGFTTSKKLGNAVVRNRIRRRVKEAFYSYDFNKKKYYDIVIVCRTKSENENFLKLKNEMKKILDKII